MADKSDGPPPAGGKTTPPETAKVVELRKKCDEISAAISKEEEETRKAIERAAQEAIERRNAERAAELQADITRGEERIKQSRDHRDLILGILGTLVVVFALLGVLRSNPIDTSTFAVKTEVNDRLKSSVIDLGAKLDNFMQSVDAKVTALDTKLDTKIEQVQSKVADTPQPAANNEPQPQPQSQPQSQPPTLPTKEEAERELGDWRIASTLMREEVFFKFCPPSKEIDRPRLDAYIDKISKEEAINLLSSVCTKERLIALTEDTPPNQTVKQEATRAPSSPPGVVAEGELRYDMAKVRRRILVPNRPH